MYTKQEALEDTQYNEAADIIDEISRQKKISTLIRYNIISEDEIEEPGFMMSETEIRDIILENSISIEDIF